VKLGKDVFEVVGHTRGLVGISADGLAFSTVSDALAIQFDVPGEAIRLERTARRARTEYMDLGRQVMEQFAKVSHERQAGVLVVTHDSRTLDLFDRILDVEDGGVINRIQPQS